MAARIGFKSYGNGPIRVLVLHDWFCDPTSWEGILPFVSLERFTYVFANFRGYGSSREIPGQYTLEEAADDALALVDRLSWTSFSVVGHSMGSLVAQKLLQTARERIQRVVALTPVPPTGLELDEDSAQYLRSMAMTDDEGRREGLSSLWGDRLGVGWLEHKVRRWRKTADPRAVAAYVDMYGRTDISAAARGIKTPMLIVTGEQDSEPFRKAALEKSMLPFYPAARIVALQECGHYPMQEQPPMLAGLIEGFVTEKG